MTLFHSKTYRATILRHHMCALDAKPVPEGRIRFLLFFFQILKQHHFIHRKEGNSTMQAQCKKEKRNSIQNGGQSATLKYPTTTKKNKIVHFIQYLYAVIMFLALHFSI